MTAQQQQQSNPFAQFEDIPDPDLKGRLKGMQQVSLALDTAIASAQKAIPARDVRIDMATELERRLRDEMALVNQQVDKATLDAQRARDQIGGLEKARQVIEQARIDAESDRTALIGRLDGLTVANDVANKTANAAFAIWERNERLAAQDAAFRAQRRGPDPLEEATGGNGSSGPQEPAPEAKPKRKKATAKKKPARKKAAAKKG